MSRRLSRGIRLYRQEGINEEDEDFECPDGDLDQFQRGYEAESGSNASGKFRTTGLVTYSPDEDQPQNLSGAGGGYQGSEMCSPREPNNSRGERFYPREQSPGGRRSPDYQPFDVCPDYQSPQASPRSARPVSPHHMSFHERSAYNSFREQGGEDLAEYDERPPSRGVSPQYRQPMCPRDDRFVPAASSSPYEPGFRTPRHNPPMNVTSSTISPYDDFTIYREIAPFSQPGRESSSPRRSPFSPDSLEPQNFSPDSLEQQDFSPDSLEQCDFSPDSLETRNFPSDCPQSQNYSPDSLEPRNTSGSPGPQISPDYLEVPHNSPAAKQCYPHRSSLRTPRTPRTPQPNEDDMNEECEGGGGTFRKPGPEYLCLNSGSSGFNVTPSPAASSAPSFGKFGLTTPSYKGRGASPPISCVGGTPKDSKREALEHLAQLTVSKPGKPNVGGSPKDCKREALEHLAQLTVSKPGKPNIGGSPKEGIGEALPNLPQITVTKPGRSCIGVTPKETNREALDQCPPCTVTKSVAPRCRRVLDFGKVVDFSPCDGQPGPSTRRLPKKPELSQDEIKIMIDSEAEDVEFAWLLSTDKKETYKKPCPKQQKAQMTVKHMVEAAQKPKGDTCGKEYPPLLEPEPEDLTPEVAAAMMFSHEQGIKLDSCPDQTITHLFPSESLQKKPPPSKISIVDPNQKDKEELMEKSASVPSEGVSDSAYTRTMKQKGGDEIPSQKSYDLDFALGQEKREVVLVPQRPKRFNTVQFRGNLTPWFPGYFSAFPDQSDSIRIVPSPSKLFLKAWIMTNPSNLPASDIIVIE